MLDKDGKALRSQIISQVIPALIACNAASLEMAPTLTPLDDAIIEKAILIANATVNALIDKQMGVS